MPAPVAPARWIVTGAGGFVAQHLLPLLSVPIALHRPGGARPVGTMGIPVDLLDEPSIRRVLAAEAARGPIAGLVHLGGAAAGGGMDPMVEKINVEGALHVADALWSLAPQAAFLQMSTGYVYGERATPADEAAPLAPLGVYACSKAVAERELLRLAAGRRLLCVRAFNHIGPGQGRGYAVADWARALAAGAPSLQTGGLDAVRDLSDVRELASALARLVRDPDAWPPVLNLCAGVSLSMRDVLGQLFAVHGGRAPRVIEGDAGRSGLQQSRGSRALADRLGMPRPRPLRQTLADVLAAAAP